MTGWPFFIFLDPPLASNKLQQKVLSIPLPVIDCHVPRLLP